MILGDDYKLMGETAKVAKQKLGCQVFRRPSYFRKAGHLQAGPPDLSSFPLTSPGASVWCCSGSQGLLRVTQQQSCG